MSPEEDRGTPQNFSNEEGEYFINQAEIELIHQRLTAIFVLFFDSIYYYYIKVTNTKEDEGSRVQFTTRSK